MNIFKEIYRLFTCYYYREQKIKDEQKRDKVLKETWDKWLDANVKLESN